MAITKPPVLPAWAETAAPADIAQPTNSEISAGWPLSTTPPSRQRFNWILNLCMNAVRYFSRRGIVDYDAAETYAVGDIVRGNDGLIYQSLQANNTNHQPSTSPAWWGSPGAPTPATADNSTKVATTAHVQAGLALKANTSGSYPGLTVGAAANATAAVAATQASSVPWTGVTGKPTTVGGYGITDAIHTGNIGAQSVNYANSAGRAYPYRWDGTPISLIWSGQAGQPNWLLGSNDGINFYVYNPANFSVFQATNASFSTTQAAGRSDATIATTQFANPAQSQSANGYVKLPGGTLWQWGSYTFGDISPNQFGSVANISFPVAFTSQVFGVYVSRTGNAQYTSAGARFVTLSGFQAYMEEWLSTVQSGAGISWFAIGV